MRHMTRVEGVIDSLLRKVRTIAVIGASPRTDRHSREVVEYLHGSGYDVIPIRPDRSPVGGLPTFARLHDVGGPVDLVVVFRRPEAVPGHIREAAAKRADAVWLPPGAWSHEAGAEAQAHHLALIKDRCIIEDHRHLAGALGESPAGHPPKQGVHVRSRRRHAATDGENIFDEGYAPGGGGGRRAGGGVRAVLDEKKMAKRRR
jgi:predicted CoA-binding protein